MHQNTTELALVAGEPARSFSRNSGIANRPNSGDALRQDLDLVKPFIYVCNVKVPTAKLASDLQR